MPVRRIVADSREARSGIIETLKKSGVQVQVRTLDVGDYIIGDCAIERKTTRDLVTSLYAGRLFEQVQRISRSYKKYMLIVEGDIQEVLGDMKNPRAYWGTLLSLTFKFDFKLLFTLNSQQTAELLQALVRKPRVKLVAENPIVVKKPRMGSTKDWQLSIVESLPAIGPKLGQQLLTGFGSVRKVFKASRSELVVKGNIGPARAAKIQQVLDAEYGNRAPKQMRLINETGNHTSRS